MRTALNPVIRSMSADMEVELEADLNADSTT